MRIHFIKRRMADDSLFLIDIDKILREKAPKQSKYIPKFVVSYLKHIVHQEELNVFLRESKDKVGVDFLKACRVLWERYPHPRGKNGRGHISCVRIQKKSLRNFFKSGGFNQNGGYLLSHCDASMFPFNTDSQY